MKEACSSPQNEIQGGGKVCKPCGTFKCSPCLFIWLIAIVLMGLSFFMGK